MLDSGAEVSSIPEPVLRQLKACLPDVQIPIQIEEGSRRNVIFADGHIVTLTDKLVALEHTVHIPWVPVVLDPEQFRVMTDCDPVPRIGRVMPDKLELNLNSNLFQLARARRALQVAVIENPDYLLSPRAGHSISRFQEARGVELEPEEAKEELVSGGLENFMGPEEELRAPKEVLDWGLRRQRRTDFLRSKRRIFEGLFPATWTAFGEHCTGTTLPGLSRCESSSGLLEGC